MNSLISTDVCLPPADGSTRVFLVRHGATEANECRPFVLQGSEIDGPLTTCGTQQAEAVSKFLSPVQLSAIYASTMQRARETAAIIALRHSLDVFTIEALQECRVGRWAGLSWEEIRRRDPELTQRFLADPANEKHPEGESYQDLQARALPAYDRIAAAHPEQNVLIMAHNMVNRVLIATLLGMDLRHARKIHQMNCCVNLLHYAKGQTDVVTVNSIWHLENA